MYQLTENLTRAYALEEAYLKHYDVLTNQPTNGHEGLQGRKTSNKNFNQCLCG